MEYNLVNHLGEVVHTEYTLDPKPPRPPRGIMSYSTARGTYEIVDQVLMYHYSIDETELALNPHAAEYALQHIVSMRRHLLDLVHCLLRPDEGYPLESDPRRYGLLGEYQELVKNLVYELTEDDDVYGSLRSTVLYRSFELHVDDTWTQSAKYVYENVDCTWEQYKIRADISGWRAYSREDFCLVQGLFSRVKGVFSR